MSLPFGRGPRFCVSQIAEEGPCKPVVQSKAYFLFEHMWGTLKMKYKYNCFSWIFGKLQALWTNKCAEAKNSALKKLNLDPEIYSLHCDSSGNVQLSHKRK
jgi:hypothetical protein